MLILTMSPWRRSGVIHCRRGNAPFPTCYHVVNNTESGNLTLDNQMRDIDHKRQHEAIGGR